MILARFVARLGLALWFGAFSARAEVLSVQGAVARALNDNPLLLAAQQDRSAARHGVSAERGARLPSAFAVAALQRNERFNAARAGIVRNEDWLATGELGLRYLTPLGSQLELGVQTNRTVRNTLVTPADTDVVSIGPNYGAQAYLSVRQPLLRSAGPKGVLGPLRQAEATERQAEHDEQRISSQLVLDVLSAYWELWYAQRAVVVQEAAEDLASTQLRQMNQRVDDLGMASRAEALRFESELATLRETSVLARTTLRLRAIELSWLLGDSTPSDELTASSEPPEAADLQPLAELRARLLASSPELAAMKAQVEVARIRARIADNANAPRVDLLASGTMTGLWTDDELPGLQLPSGRPALGAMLGVEFDAPLGRSRESGEAARADAQWRAARSRYEALANALVADVVSSHAEVAQSVERVRLAREAVAVAAALAEAERQRYQLGSATSLDVVLAQQNHRQSELRRLRAVVDRTVAQLRLEHQLGRLLELHASSAPRRPPS